jgi:hypothetical protein
MRLSIATRTYAHVDEINDGEVQVFSQIVHSFFFGRAIFVGFPDVGYIDGKAAAGAWMLLGWVWGGKPFSDGRD